MDNLVAYVGIKGLGWVGRNVDNSSAGTTPMFCLWIYSVFEGGFPQVVATVSYSHVNAVLLDTK